MDKKSKSLHKSWRKWARTPPTRAKNSKKTEQNGSGGGRKKRIKSWGCFVPVGATNRDQRPYICPGWWLQPGLLVRGSFGPGWSRQPGRKSEALVPVGVSNWDERTLTLMVPVGATNRDKCWAFGPSWWLQPGQKAPVPPRCPASR